MYCHILRVCAIPTLESTDSMIHNYFEVLHRSRHEVQTQNEVKSVAFYIHLES